MQFGGLLGILLLLGLLVWLVMYCRRRATTLYERADQEEEKEEDREFGNSFTTRKTDDF